MGSKTRPVVAPKCPFDGDALACVHECCRQEQKCFAVVDPLRICYAALEPNTCVWGCRRARGCLEIADPVVFERVFSNTMGRVVATFRLRKSEVVRRGGTPTDWEIAEEIGLESDREIGWYRT